MKCPHCNQQTAQLEFCDKCGKVLPVPADQDFYTVLGYPARILQIDEADLEKRLFELNRKFHPDRFAGKSAQEIQFSHDRSSAVNNAYRTLKNPVSRAKYIVESTLGSIEEKSAKVPIDMAERFFEIQDLLETIRESNGNPPADAVREVREAEKELKEKVKSLEADLQKQFTAYDAKPDRKIVEQMKEILSERSYIKSFLRQLDGVMNPDDVI
ncbi:MAG TPA: Fe-S protein assembly co-chaperone HscB [Acidobacteriota bacterium]|nr:Fe-S protein assembly co-chaperone HscB [Acidobacteriota bacterium]